MGTMPRFSFSSKGKDLHWFQRPIFIAFVFILALCPLGAILSSYYSRAETLNRYSSDLEYLQLQVSRRIVEEQEKRDFLERFGKADHYYVEKHIEKMTFLTGEIYSLETIFAHPVFQKCTEIKGRLDRIGGDHNKLRFSEVTRHSKSRVEEIELTQMHPVEVEMKDLKKVLAYVEGVSIDEFDPFPHRPQFIIKAFDLSWKRDQLWLTMDIIQRRAV